MEDNANLKPISKIIRLIETVIRRRMLDRLHHKDEVEKYFSYLCQHRDLLSVYERRAAGVQDEEWKIAVKEFNEVIRKEADPE